MRYHINQQVRVRPDLHIYDDMDDEVLYYMDDGIEYNTVTEEMVTYAGQVLRVLDYEDGQYILTGPADVYWTDEMLLPVATRVSTTKELPCQNTE